MCNALLKFHPSFLKRKTYELCAQIFSRYTSAMLVALWHGAALNFFIWGLALWVLATLEQIFVMIGIATKNPTVKRRIFNILAMTPVYFLTGIFFRSTSIESLSAYLKGLFGPNLNGVSFIDYADPVYWRIALAFAIDGAMYYNLKTKRFIFLSPLADRARKMADKWPIFTYIVAGIGAAALIVLAIAFRSNDNLAGFIYFRF